MDRNPEDIRRAAKIFKALSHPGRLEVACHLSQDGPQTQKTLIESMGCPQSTMARHLFPLRELGLVEGQRHGSEVIFRVTSKVISQMVQSLCDWLHDEHTQESKEDA